MAEGAEDKFKIYADESGEGSAENENSELKIGLTSQTQSVGKENIRPTTKAEDEEDLENAKSEVGNAQNGGKSTCAEGVEGNAEFCSAFGDTDDARNRVEESGGEEASSEEDDCPSEYMTAHCSLKAESEQFQQRHIVVNPMYSAYDSDIYSWMLHRERHARPRNYMPKQSAVKEDMRALLINWFVDVIAEFELSPATFFLSVSLTDRTLSLIDCPSEKLQLLGGTALLVAAKIHEIYPPSVKDIVYVTDDSYTDDQVQRMEKIVLKSVEYKLGLPLVDSFAEFLNHFAPLSQVYRHMMWYLLELSTLSFRAARLMPSRLAAAAYLIAFYAQEQKRKDCLNASLSLFTETIAEGEEKEEGNDQESAIEGEGEEEEMEIGQKALLSDGWPDEMENKTGILRDTLVEPVQLLLHLREQARASDSKLQAVPKKFSSARRDCVALLQLPTILFASHNACVL